ncbi:MAG: four-carbon acid sugar kinase family protein, partial [Acetatifactor sp.]|nr:four-carbon acid sugar kinase family protein [Acetatifactor sp.]
MSRILIVADDLTGANDTGVRFAKCGAKVFTVLDKEHVNWEKAGDCDCITLSTDSRGLPPREAYERVHRAVRKFSGRETILYSKRIDSTLRGNLGAETDAMLDALADDRMAVVVPAFPEAGRTYVGGHLLVCGVPLFRTA